MSKERVIIFIDHANVYKNLELVGRRIDWNKFKQELKKDSHLVGTLIYIGVPNPIPTNQQKFIKYLVRVEYTLRQVEIQELPDGERHQKGVDILMFKDIEGLAKDDAFDKAIIVSGDRDFVEAIRTLKEYKKRFEIWSFKKSLSKKLKKVVGSNNIHYIDYILDKIEMRSH